MHLFARNGLDGVTLRRISSESGSANTAAVHYHFKDRAGPIDAIIIFLDENVWMPAFLRLKEGIDAGVSLRELIDLGLWPGKQTVFDHPGALMLRRACSDSKQGTMRWPGASSATCARSTTFCSSGDCAERCRN